MEQDNETYYTSQATVSPKALCSVCVLFLLCFIITVYLISVPIDYLFCHISNSVSYGLLCIIKPPNFAWSFLYTFPNGAMRIFVLFVIMAMMTPFLLLCNLAVRGCNFVATELPLQIRSDQDV